MTTPDTPAVQELPDQHTPPDPTPEMWVECIRDVLLNYALDAPDTLQ